VIDVGEAATTVRCAGVGGGAEISWVLKRCVGMNWLAAEPAGTRTIRAPTAESAKALGEVFVVFITGAIGVKSGSLDPRF
jgi:hypothetical protein